MLGKIKGVGSEDLLVNCPYFLHTVPFRYTAYNLRQTTTEIIFSQQVYQFQVKISFFKGEHTFFILKT